MYSGISRDTGLLLSKKDKTYVDISLAFEPNALTGDITTIRDTRAIDNSIKNIIQFAYLEVPFQPDLGSSVSDFLFDPCDLATASILELEISAAIKTNEPRVEIVEISVIPETTGRQSMIIQDKTNSDTFKALGNSDSKMDFYQYTGTTESVAYNSGRTAADSSRSPEFINEALASSGSFTVSIAYRIVGTEEIFEVSQLLVATR